MGSQFIKNEYPAGTIGHSMQVPEQEGKDAWLAGIPRNKNPYDPNDLIRHTFWALGWEFAKLAFVRKLAKGDEG